MCIVDLLPSRLARLQRAVGFRMKGLHIVMDNVADPGNRAAVMRSAEAFGILNVHVISTLSESERRSSPYFQKKYLRSVTTGSEKWLNLHNHSTAQNCVDALRRESAFRILCAKPPNPEVDKVRGDPTPLHHVDFGQETALVFGNESFGVSAAMSDLSDGDFTIPMYGLTESFNISVAAGICLHWGRLARERAIGKQTDLSEEEAMQLMTSYQSAHTHYQQKMRVLRQQQARIDKLQDEAENLCEVKKAI